MDNHTGSHCPLGVCVIPSPPRNASRTVSYPEYIFEVLNHAGLFFQSVEWPDLAATLPELRILVTVGETKPEPEIAESLRAWVNAGGAWIAISGVCSLPDIFGVEVEAPSYSSWGGGVGNLGEGYLKPVDSAHAILSHLEIPLHYFNGLPVRSAGCSKLAGVLDKHQRDSDRIAISVNSPGNGTALFIAPDFTGTIVRIQQGTAVTRDGVSSPDGAAPVCDGVLKSDDGCALDWIFDRQPVAEIPGLNAFLHPIADQWREILLRAIFHAASQHDVPLFALWLYPRNLPALAHMSHDTDGSETPKAYMLLKALADAEIHTTWCTILPPYPDEVIKAVAEAGHELAMHYDSMSEGTVFSEKEFREQHAELTRLFGGKHIVTNKNHYLRWEGDVELFEWCQRLDIQLDQTKGTSKTGEAGFNFGTCHTYFPVAPDGSMLDVLELPTPTQDLHVFAPPAIALHILKGALRNHGIMHLLFHPAHMDKPNVPESLVDIAREARRQGLEWWTAEQINAWERARRKARWTRSETNSDGALAGFKSHEAMPGATLLSLRRDKNAGNLSIDDTEVPGESVRRWGFEFNSATLDLEAEREIIISTRTLCQTK